LTSDSGEFTIYFATQTVFLKFLSIFTMRQNIFISYRRMDSEGSAGRIYDHLQACFGVGRVFMDVTDIRVGEDFSDAIHQAISSCKVVIVLIGPRWHSIQDEMGRKRLDDPHDFVRVEVQAALESDALVVPVLVHGAKMPKDVELPVDLRALARRNAIEIRHRHFENDIEILVAELENYLGNIEQFGRGQDHSRRDRRFPTWAWLLILLLVVVLSGFSIQRWMNGWGISNLTAREITDTPSPSIVVVITDTATATSDPPTATATEVASQTPLLTSTNTATFTPLPTFTPTETPLPAQMLDPFGVTMVLVPQGPFIMGTNERNLWDLVARPAHTVSLGMFYIDKYEVSNAQYATCVLEGGCQAPNLIGSKTRGAYYGNPQYADYPVVYVSWHDAQAYCAWRGGRLPGEDEWEKAARGDDQRVYPWGTTQTDCQHANFWPTGACEGDTTAINQQLAGASPYGAINMSGNVAEWVNDWFQPYPGGDPNATKEFGITNRVIRGGAYFDGPNNIRATARKGLGPDAAHSYVGFRCVIEIDALP
jgi:formylglycine-generating enzyme required for sulfatase activity